MLGDDNRSIGLVDLLYKRGGIGSKVREGADVLIDNESLHVYFLDVNQYDISYNKSKI